MPAFAWLGSVVAGWWFAAGTAAFIATSWLVATGAAFVTSRIINGNANKRNNSSDVNQGGRVQVPPQTNNKIPVLYGNAYVNGIITDARLISTDQKINNTMYYCIVLSETCNNPNAVYGVDAVYWNDLRLTPINTTNLSHLVKDGRKTVSPIDTVATAFVVGRSYKITLLGTTTQAQWNTTAGTSGVTYQVGSTFTCAVTGVGTGRADTYEDFIDTNFKVNDTTSLVEIRVYAGGTAAPNQIYPSYSGNKISAIDFWPNPNTTIGWDPTYNMSGLVYAIVKVTFNAEKGFTSLPTMTFKLANNVSNPADVWYDYMTSKRYGAGIDSIYIDSTAKTAWANFCNEDITYTDQYGNTNQFATRYDINGLIDTNNQVKTNIDTILQNAGAWMSYDVSTGLWSPVIKKAITAGDPADTATYFTASRSGSTLTVSNFEEGRIEAGQLLYNSAGTLIGTISAQITPLTAGETSGQKGRYTTSTSGSISSTTFFTTAPNLLTFTDDNIISGINISSTRLDDLYNSVEAEFYDRWNRDQKAYARTELPANQRNPNEPDNQLRMGLDLCNNSMQADLLGQMELRQSRDDLVIEFTSNQYGIQTQAGDIINVYSDLYDWSPKLFRVMRVKEQETEEGGLVAQIQALEYNGDVYTIEPITEFTTEANIGIGVYGASPNLPQPPDVVIASVDADSAIPNFQLQVTVPTTGGPYDEIELYYTEGWDQHPITGTIVPGTGSNGAPVGQGLLTVTDTTYGSINPGDQIDLATDIYIVSQLTNTPSSKTFVSGGAPASSTSTLLTLNDVTGLIVGNTLTGTGIPNGSFIIEIDAGTNTVRIEDAVTVQAAGTYTVSGGLGTYIVDTSTTQTLTAVNLYDFPEVDNYKLLKKIVPEGNTATFTNGEIIRDVITNVPANSATYRRWFIKARMGIKKRFGAFSNPGNTDFNKGRFPYNPNPGGGGGPVGPLPGVFTKVDINSTTPFLTFSTQPDGVNPQYGIRGKSTVDDPWFVGAGSTGDDLGYLEIATGDNAGLSNSGGQIYVRQYNGASPGTGAPWFGGNGTVVNELTLLDSTGNTVIPKNLTVDNGALFVDSVNNRVGINNSSPSYELHIDSGLDATTQFAMTNNERTFIITNEAGSSDLVSFNLGGGNRLQFNTTDQWFNSGKLGINDSTPSYTLDVNGDLRVVTDAWFDANARVTGNLAVNGGNLTTTQTTFNLLNSTTTTLNIGGASTTTNIGSTASGTTIIGWDAVVNKDLAVNGGDITTTQTTFNLLNTTATTLNIGGASTATNIGASTGTTTIGNDLAVKGANLILNSDGTGSDDVVIRFERGATDATIMWSETGGDRFVISNDVEIQNNLIVDNDATVTGDIIQITSSTVPGPDIEYKNIITTAIWAKYNNSLYYDPTTYRAIDGWSRDTYSSAKYILNVENTTDVTRYQIIECLVIGSSTPYITIYGDVFNDGNTIMLRAFEDTINSPGLIQLQAYAVLPVGISGGITRITGHRILFAKAT